MMKTILIRSKNIAATEFYYDIIRAALNQCSEVIFDGFEGEKLPKEKDALVIVGSCISFMRVRKMGYKRIITWFQGVLPEESYMRNQSVMRKCVLEVVEKYALKKSILSIFVSEALKEHYEQKYNLDLKNCYIMPCFNTTYQEESVKQKKNEKKIFTYIGGLSKWQCIEQTLKLYKRIEDIAKDKVELLLLTSEQEKAEKLVKKYEIRYVEIACVHYTELSQKLQKVSFGFVLREDSVVNRVATPTKLANYIANGIMPIYSKCILDFASISKENPFQVIINDVNDIQDYEIEKMVYLLNNDISKEKLDEQCRYYFRQYYNAEWHIKKLASIFGEYRKVVEKIEK